ncbi:MAG: C39 family peptidase [Silvanigrellales bacterium]|nr:C39 family peptidase [Silvanigrellales bacterium]
MSPRMALGVAIGLSIAVFLYSGCKRTQISSGSAEPRPTPAFTAGDMIFPASVVPAATAPAAATPVFALKQPVRYFYQYDNANEPGGTCGLTSVAMVLSAFGHSATPDELYSRFGKSKAQEPSGVASILQSYGLRADATKLGSRATLKEHLASGLPAIVHGDWTGSGHIVVFKAVNEKGWLANDPAGNWEQCYKCASRGESVTYAFNGRFDKLLSYDGDVWFTLVHGP